jgi:hypothetical protein
MFKKLTLVALLLTFAATPVLAQRVNDQMVARRPNTQIFANEVREAFESAIMTIGTDDVVTITDVRSRHFRIRTANGTEGFVAKNDLNRASQAQRSRAFAFEAADVVGYLDNPTPVYIIDMDDPNADPITLDRSFREALKENVDRETMERLAR